MGGPWFWFAHNLDGAYYDAGNSFGDLAFLLDDIYQSCDKLEAGGVTILRPPRDGHMAFVKDPSGISIELLQAGESLKPKPKWANRESIGEW